MNCPIPTKCHKGVLGVGVKHLAGTTVQVLPAAGEYSPNVFFNSTGNVSATFQVSDLASTVGSYMFSLYLVMPTGLMNEDFFEGANQPNWNITVVDYPL
jgi:hypothetical protein